jgi:hypothetical protein
VFSLRHEICSFIAFDRAPPGSAPFENNGSGRCFLTFLS